MERSERKLKLKERLLDRMDMSRDVTDEELEDLIDECLLEECIRQYIPLPEREKLRKDLFASMRQLDCLQELITDPNITEIMVNGCNNIFVEEEGKIRQYDERFDSEEKLSDVIQQIVSKCNRTVNESSPIVDARLENGSRVNVVLPPVALNGPILTIRRFPEHPFTMEKLIQTGALTEEAAEFLEKLVRARYNIFVSGGTGSGKTTMLNALSGYVPKTERIITIEDSAELQILGVPNLVRMETRNANTEGCQEISIRDLIHSSLRMRPDRLIVGEIRGAEALDMLQAMNTGSDGSMSTGHANSARDMLSRIETMVLMGSAALPLPAIRQQIASGIDIILHLGRLRDKSRKVLEITEVDRYEDGQIHLNTLYRFEEKGSDENGKVLGKLAGKGELIHDDKLKAAGIAASCHKPA
ncbi:MAG: CpaF family protein [Lachnospiraceae bacterium]|nr:CpaF family protein [Lachnospiraceae bacterium]